MTPDVLMSVQNLRWVRSDRIILDVPEFSIQPNEVIALIGANGDGKSSLLKMLALLEKPDSGEITFRNVTVSDRPLVVRRRMAMVFQEPLLLSGSVFKNVAQGLVFRGLPRSVIAQRVHAALSDFGIAHLSRRNQKHLSGGEAQRVSLARAMVIEPEILFLDEPFAALDLPTRQSLAEDIGRVIRQRGISAVFVTHNAEELSLFTDRICIMEKGMIIQEGSPEEIFNRPANRVAARLVGVENSLSGTIHGPADRQGYQNVQVGPHQWTVPGPALQPGIPVDLYIRPEAILPATDSDFANTFTGKIAKTISLNSQYKLVIECGFSVTVLVSKGTHALHDVKPGQEFRIHVPPDRVHVAVK